MCQSRLTHGLVQPFTRLYNGSWVFAALSSQVPVEMHCPQSTIPTSLLGFGVINLMEGCTLSSADFHYPHTFTSYTSVDISFSLNSPHDKMDEQDYEDYGDYNEVPRPFNFDSSEPLVIAANEAEVEEDYFSNELTTRVSVESSVNVISNIPEQGEDIHDSETKKSGLVTKEDFIKDAAIANVANIMDVMVSSNDIQMSVATELPNTELKLVPEGADTDTELHHDVLLKLRNKIKNGKHWLDDFTSAVREIRKAM